MDGWWTFAAGDIELSGPSSHGEANLTAIRVLPLCRSSILRQLCNCLSSPLDAKKESGGPNSLLTQRPFSWMDHLVRPQQQRRRDRQPERFGSLEVDGKFELRGLLDGQFARLGALENLVHVNRGAPGQVANGSSISHEATEFHVLPGVEHRGQAVLCRERDDACALTKEHRAREREEGFGMLSDHRGEGAVELVRTLHLRGLKLHRSEEHTSE